MKSSLIHQWLIIKCYKHFYWSLWWTFDHHNGLQPFMDQKCSINDQWLIIHDASGRLWTCFFDFWQKNTSIIFANLAVWPRKMSSKTVLADFGFLPKLIFGGPDRANGPKILNLKFWQKVKTQVPGIIPRPRGLRGLRPPDVRKWIFAKSSKIPDFGVIGRSGRFWQLLANFQKVPRPHFGGSKPLAGGWRGF